MLCAVTTRLSDGCHLATRSHAGAGDGRGGWLKIRYLPEKTQTWCITNTGVDIWWIWTEVRCPPELRQVLEVSREEVEAERVKDCESGITVTGHGSRKWGSPEALTSWGKAPSLMHL